MFKTVIFDLNCDLGKQESEKLHRRLMTALAKHMSAAVPEELFAPTVEKCLQFVANHASPNFSNQEVFTDQFARSFGLDGAAFWKLFRAYFDEEFSGLRAQMPDQPLLRAMLEKALYYGVETVVVGDAFLPQTAAEQRLRCLDLDPARIAMICGMENMHNARADVEFMQEIIGRLGRQPEECLLVCHSAEEEKAALSLGMQLFVLEEAEGSAQVKSGGLDAFTALLTEEKTEPAAEGAPLP